MALLPTVAGESGDQQTPELARDEPDQNKGVDKWDFASDVRRRIAIISSSNTCERFLFRNIGEKRVIIEEAKKLKLYFEVDEWTNVIAVHVKKPPKATACTSVVTGADTSASTRASTSAPSTCDSISKRAAKKAGKGKGKGKGPQRATQDSAIRFVGSGHPDLDDAWLYGATPEDTSDGVPPCTWRAYPFEVVQTVTFHWEVWRGAGSDRTLLLASPACGPDVVEAFAAACQIELQQGADVQRGREELLSRQLSSTLRHKAVAEGLEVQLDGYIYVDELLAQKRYKKWDPRITLEELQWLADNNAKRRYELARDADGRWKIRATQGHTMKNVRDEELLEPLTSADEYPVVVHGTYCALFDQIFATGSGGLKTMGRNHIHFATYLPGQGQRVISGLRADADLAICIDMKKALGDGIKFFRSKNGVLLTPGLCNDRESDGVLPKKYFKDVIDIFTGKSVTREWTID